MIESPSLYTLQRKRTATGKNSGERTARKAEALAIVARRVFHILYLEHRLRPVLTGKREIVGIVQTEAVLAGIVLLLHKCLAPFVGIFIIVHIEIHLKKHCLCSTLGDTTEVLVGVLALIPQKRLGNQKVVDNLLIYLIGSGTRLLPFIRAVNNEIHIRNTSENSHQTEIIVRTHKMHLTEQAVLPLLRHSLVRLDGRHLLQRKVATRDALILRTIEIEQQTVVGIGLEILDVVCVSHISGVLTAFQSVVGSHITDKPFGEISGVILPGQRSVASIGRLYGRRS